MKKKLSISVSVSNTESREILRDKAVFRVAACCAAVAVVAGVLFGGCSDSSISGALYDSKIGLKTGGDGSDGGQLKAVTIGRQTWMAKNLNIETGNSWCYHNKESNCKRFGRLYDWNTAKTACPSGWHLPSRAEWDTLVNFVGGSFVAGEKLRSKTGWCDEGDGNGTDEYGFSALPGGYRLYSGGSFDDAGYNGYWWAATERSDGDAYVRLYYGSDYLIGDCYGKGYGCSVRCVHDN